MYKTTYNILSSILSSIFFKIFKNILYTFVGLISYLYIIIIHQDFIPSKKHFDLDNTRTLKFLNSTFTFYDDVEVTTVSYYLNYLYLIGFQRVRALSTVIRKINNTLLIKYLQNILHRCIRLVKNNWLKTLVLFIVLYFLGNTGLEDIFYMILIPISRNYRTSATDTFIDQIDFNKLVYDNKYFNNIIFNPILSKDSLQRIIDIIKMEESNLIYEADYEYTKVKIDFIIHIITLRIQELDGEGGKPGTGATKIKIKSKKSGSKISPNKTRAYSTSTQSNIPNNLSKFNIKY